ncbi:restriction endonuclease subunit S [Clostridium sp. M62/1]|uniref:restriction endonuclease subunit S n=1 Tax=Clostridium sp. M62/1 TaxID=411486 RepID=UPI0035692158
MELKEYRFDEVTDNFDKKRIPLSSAQRKKRQGKYRYYGAQGVIDHIDDFIFDGTYLLIAEDGENLKSKKQNIAQVVDGQFWVNNHAHIVQGNELCDTRYLCYLLNSMDLSGYVTGSAQPKLSQANLNAVTLLLPTITVQKKIVHYLYMFDKKITVNQQINDNLERQAAAIFRSWFVDCIPFGSTVPDEWKNVTLEDITALISRGISPKYADDTDQTVINQKCIRNHIIDLSFARSHRPKVINNKWLQFGDLLINSTGDGTLGRAAQVWFQPHNLTVDSHVTIVRPAAENMIFYIGLWGTQHEKEIESLHTGSTGQTELPRDRVKAIELLLPDKETLERFNALIAPMAAAIVSNQEENNRLASIRDALLPKLMSGKIDVSSIRL